MQCKAKRILIAAADPNARMCYAYYCTRAGWDVRTSGDGREVLNMLQELPTDVLLCQLPLKVYDGLEVLRRIPESGLYLCPGIVMLLHPGMERFDGRASELGARICLSNHADMQEICDACANITSDDRLYALRGRGMKIRQLLLQLGFPATHVGTGYLETALAYTVSDGRLLRDLAHGLYPLTAAKHETDAARVERGIRHAIEAAWGSGSVEEQYALFENTIDEKRGKPTNAGMIARATEVLRVKEATV